MDHTQASFDEFWTDYVRAHRSKTSRTLHVIGMSLALACVLAAVFKRRPWLLAFAPVFAYGFAWCGHFFVEKNFPSSFSHPIMSARAGALMFWKTICGEMDAEVARVVADEAAEATAEPKPVPAEAMN